MLISEKVKVKWNNANRVYYESLGYIFTKNGDEFDVIISHLSKGSHSEVLVECDYCKTIMTKKYKVYLKSHNSSNAQKDCCANCIGKKSNETYFLEHGCHISEGEGNWIKMQNTIKNRYDVENISQLQIIKDRRETTLIEKYGEDYACKRRAKGMKTMFEKYGQKSVMPKGEQHYRWQGGKVSEIQKQRKTITYNDWRKTVFARDKYICQCCFDKKKYDLNAHHLYGFARYPELRFEVDNGITLCEDCHNSFHGIYDKKGDNTNEQFLEFIANIKKDVTTNETTTE